MQQKEKPYFCFSTLVAKLILHGKPYSLIGILNAGNHSKNTVVFRNYLLALGTVLLFSPRLRFAQT